MSSSFHRRSKSRLRWSCISTGIRGGPVLCRAASAFPLLCPPPLPGYAGTHLGVPSLPSSPSFSPALMMTFCFFALAERNSCLDLFFSSTFHTQVSHYSTVPALSRPFPCGVVLLSLATCCSPSLDALGFALQVLPSYLQGPALLLPSVFNLYPK